MAVPEKKVTAGAPAWMATFADLATLLMSFFVLLLSFSEMDLLKYKQVAGSMKEAFGIQREFKVRESPRGDSLIMKQFTPGTARPTPLARLQQHTEQDKAKYQPKGSDRIRQSKNKHAEKVVTEFRRRLVESSEGSGDPGHGGLKSASAGTNTAVDANAKDKSPEQKRMDQALAEAIKMVSSDLVKENADLADKKINEIIQALQDEIAQGIVSYEIFNEKLILSFEEKVSFPSAQAEVRSQFIPVLEKIGTALLNTNGKIIVAGHADNLPIRTERYRSNWDLSAARAASVVHQLIERAQLPPQRMVAEGHGDAHPIFPNTTPENRAKNRRVEIVLIQDENFSW
jgi:chemotaxis protein MotB